MMIRSDHRQRQLEAVVVAPQGGADLGRDVRLPDDLEVVAALRRVLQPQHPSCRVVDELHTSVLVDDEHALDHAAENGFHSRAIGREVGSAAADLAHRVVE